MKSKNGARGRNRTGTVLPPRDFKSLASTNFATRAYMGRAYILLIFIFPRQRFALLSTTTPPGHIQVSLQLYFNFLFQGGASHYCLPQRHPGISTGRLLTLPWLHLKKGSIHPRMIRGALAFRLPRRYAPRNDVGTGIIVSLVKLIFGG